MTWHAILLEAVIRRYSGQNCQVGCYVYVYFQWPRKYPFHQYTTNNCWYKAEWVHAFSFQILTLPSECRSRNRNSSDQATLFQFSIVQWAHLSLTLVIQFCATDHLQNSSPHVLHDQIPFGKEKTSVQQQMFRIYKKGSFFQFLFHMELDMSHALVIRLPNPNGDGKWSAFISCFYPKCFSL